ncbi:MAG TPA: F0F1 ATP synthase subunit gamma [Candidatus Saccharimonadales bacterium]|nr:F0F1 ATP synthase subunit gamma [Candidatus Saccharimonadales bacterium]
MYSKAELKKYSDAVATIKAITAVYEDAAARRIKVIQGHVAQIDEFLNNAADSYINIKFGLVAEQKSKKSPQKNIITTSFRKKNKKGVLVLIASHEQYFGNLIPNLYRIWKDDLLATGFDGIILGGTGQRLLQKDGISRPNIASFDVSDNDPDWNLVYQIADQISDYEKIVIYFGKYKTVLTQAAEKSDVSNTMTVGQVQNVKRYLFEGSPEQILDFFEKEVIHGLFQKKIYESQIARYGARIKILEIGQVAEKMSEVLGDLSRGRRKVRKNLTNKKQLQLYTGSDLWQE